MGNNHKRARDQLHSGSGSSQRKTLKRGFGVVRKLTNASQQEIFQSLDEADVSDGKMRRQSLLHLTLIEFMKMTQREQAAFNAGLSVARLEEKLEEGITKEAPRCALTVTLSTIGLLENILFAEVDDPRIENEQLKIAGQVAMNGIAPQKINKKIMPPHVTLGVGNIEHIEELREQVETAVMGQPVALERWFVYPDRYA